jgi:hypothetical protein
MHHHHGHDSPCECETPVRSGRWSDPGTWRVVRPRDVKIPPGVEVVYDVADDGPIRRLDIHGTLSFAADADTRLVADTIVVHPGGRLDVGTEGDPIRPGVAAEIVFADLGPIDPLLDPLFEGRGLMVHPGGAVGGHGAPKEAFVTLTAVLRPGDTVIPLDAVPAGWNVGDEVIVTAEARNEDERRTILAIGDDGTLSVEPLRFGHAPLDGFPLHVGNLTRNVTFRSENPEIDRRGHIMVMGAGPRSDFAHVAFRDLGRTHKRFELTDPKLDEDGVLIPGTGDNPRGRYALHYHHHRTPDGSADRVVGCALSGTPGWGFVNHSSHVEMVGNVAYNGLGALFVTEDGDERGSFEANLAVRATGYYSTANGSGEKTRVDTHDFGHSGFGFWFQGSDLRVVDNVAASCRMSGFAYGIRTAKRLTIPADRLANPALAAAYAGDVIRITHVPIREFRDNYAYGSITALWSISQYMGPVLQHHGVNVVDGLRGRNLWVFIYIHYSRHWSMRRLHLVNDPDRRLFASTDGFDLDRNGDAMVADDPILANCNRPFHVRSTGFVLANATEGHISTPHDHVSVASDPSAELSFTPSAPLEVTRTQNRIDFGGTVTDSLGPHAITIRYDGLRSHPVIDGHYRLPYAIHDRLTGASRDVIIPVRRA